MYDILRIDLPMDFNLIGTVVKLITFMQPILKKTISTTAPIASPRRLIHQVRSSIDYDVGTSEAKYSLSGSTTQQNIKGTLFFYQDKNH